MLLTSLLLWPLLDQYLIHSQSLHLSFSPPTAIQTQENNRISLVPQDPVVLLLSLPEEDRD